MDIVESEGFWLLGVWLSARESLERDGYLFLLREISSTLYVHHDERIVFSECQLYESMRIYACVDIYCQNYYGIKVRIFAYISFDFTFHTLFNLHRIYRHYKLKLT